MYRTCLPSKADDAKIRECIFLPPTVQFTAHNVDLARSGTQTSGSLALPNPQYLRIHAACCKVAHLSGAAEYLDEAYRDMEMLQVLTNDGSSAQVLDVAL